MEMIGAEYDQFIELPDDFWEQIQMDILCRSRWLEWATGITDRLGLTHIWNIPVEDTVEISWTEQEA